MRRLNGHLVTALLISAGLVGCGFNPGPAGAALNGAAANSGNGSEGGSNGNPITGGGVGLTSGGNGDVNLGTGGMDCGQSSVPVMPEPPDVLIVQDKSGSMNYDDADKQCTNRGGCGANSKWSQLTTALSNVVQATQMNVRWGIKYFSDDNGCGASAAPAVAIGDMNAAAIVASVGRMTPGGNTPTRDAITSGATYLSTLSDSNPKFLLLATDGLPNCPSGCATMRDLSGGMCTLTDNPDEDAAAEAAVSMAAMMGFPTFVVGIGDVTAAQNTLNQLAINGGEAQAGAATSYYAAADEAALEDALTKIVGVVASCTIPLTNVPANLSNVAVSVDDSNGNPTKIPQDPNNGWSYTDTQMTSIQLHGSYCDSVKNGTYSNVKFVYACAGGPPICIDRLANGQCGDAN